MSLVIVNSVHDSIVVDVHPNEEKEVLDVIKITNDNMIPLIEKDSITPLQVFHKKK